MARGDPEPGEGHKVRARESAAAELRRSPEDLLADIVAEARDKKRLSGDEIIVDMIAKFSSLLVVLSRDLDRAQRVVVRLTWVIVVLTVVLLLLTVAQVYVTLVSTYAASQVPAAATATLATAPAVEQ